MSEAKLERVVAICGDRLKVGGDILAYADFFFLADEEIRYAEPISDDDAKLLCFWRDVVDCACTGPYWRIADLERETKGVAEHESVKLGHLVKLIRYAISGKTTGPGLYESLVELGQRAVHNRIGNRIGYPWNAEIKAAVIMARRLWLSRQIPRLTQRQPDLAYYQMIVDRGGGIITLGDFLGVFVSPIENARRTPAGWLFVPLEGLTAEKLKQWVEDVRPGRKAWPEKEVQPKADKRKP